MGECKYCGRKGWLLPVSVAGLCFNCEPMISLEIKQRIRIINDSRKLIGNSKNIDVQISRCDLIIEQASALYKYEQRNIETINPLPSAHINEFTDLREDIIILGLKRELENANAKVKMAANTKTKINHYNKVLLKIMDLKGMVRKNQQIITQLEDWLNHTIHQIQLDSYLEDAKKAEFKNQPKKALDKYYEALYFLKHDEIDDALQQDHISIIESKIKELSGENK